MNGSNARQRTVITTPRDTRESPLWETGGWVLVIYPQDTHYGDKARNAKAHCEDLAEPCVNNQAIPARRTPCSWHSLPSWPIGRKFGCTSVFWRPDAALLLVPRLDWGSLSLSVVLSISYEARDSS